MFQTKRSKIAAYLRTALPSPFAALLADWYSGRMQERLTQLGRNKPVFHIDWLPDYQCIDIQARWAGMFADIQIEPESFAIAVDADEPDDPQEFPLNSPDGFYRTIRSFLES